MENRLLEPFRMFSDCELKHLGSAVFDKIFIIENNIKIFKTKELETLRKLNKNIEIVMEERNIHEY